MEFPIELVEKLKNANSVEEVITLVKEYDIEITEEEVIAFVDQFNNDEIADDDLADITGGLVQLINPSSSIMYRSTLRW